MYAVEINNVSRYFKETVAVDNLSLKVKKNIVYAILGPNGSGKSTTINMVLGLLKTTEGDIKINGQSVTFGETDFLEKVGYVNDVPEFYDWMSARDYLSFILGVYKVPKEKQDMKIKEVLEFVHLEDTKMKIKNYSRGMKQRLGIAQALINEPVLLILDEPTSALDPIGRKEVLEIIRRLSKQMTIFYSSHLLDEVERICDEIAIIDRGKLLLNGSMADIKEKFFGSVYQLELSEMNDQVKERLMNLEEVTQVEEDGAFYKIFSQNGFEKHLIDLCHHENVYIKSLMKKHVKLEDVFVKVVRENESA